MSPGHVPAVVVALALGLVADLSGHYGSFADARLSQLAFMAGARWTWRTGRVRPFAEGLLGGTHSSTSLDVDGGSASDAGTLWGLALGGGADYPLGRRWAVRGLAYREARARLTIP
jgi:opacity protein-like surface antigen